MRIFLLIILPLLIINLTAAIELNGIKIELEGSDGDLWVKDGSIETYKFNVQNLNSSYNIDKIKIDIPQSFILNENPLIDNSSWNCLATTFILCQPISNNQSLSFNNAINIRLNVTSSNIKEEKTIPWKVNIPYSENELNFTLNSFIDGKPPQIESINQTYLGLKLNNTYNVTKREPIVVEVNASEYGSGINRVWLVVYNSSQNTVQEKTLEGNNKFIGEINTSCLEYGNYTVRVFANDSVGNLNDSIQNSFSFFTEPLPDIQVSPFTWNPINPYPGQNLTVYANISLINSSYQKIKVKWFLDSLEVSNESIEISNGKKQVNYTFISFSGEKNITLLADPENLIDECSKENNVVSKIFSTDLNVSILGFLYKGISYTTSIPMVEHNATLILNISVNYWGDNNPVLDLNKSNFEIYDKYQQFLNKTDKMISISSISPGVYYLSYITPDISEKKLEYGEHEIKITIKEGLRVAETPPKKYFLDGPSISISLNDITPTNPKVDEKIIFDIKVKNTGNKTIYGVNLTSISSTLDSAIFDFDKYKTLNKNLSAGESMECENVGVKFSRDGKAKIIITLNGTYDSRELEFQTQAGSIQIEKTSTSTISSQSSGQNVDESEFDDGLQVVKSTSSKTTTTDSKPTYLNIKSSPSKIEIEQKERRVENITVENTHNIEFQNVKLKVFGMPESWVNIVPSSEVEIEPKTSYQYKVIFEIPSNAEPKDYSGFFEASSPFEVKKNPFTLSIIPGPELKKQIDEKIEMIENQIKKLKSEIETKKNYNTTEAEAQLSQLENWFDKLVSYRDGGNYKKVYELIGEAENMVNQTTNTLSGAVVLPMNLSSRAPEIILPGIGTIAVIGGYTFWGRHFKISHKIVKNIKKIKIKDKNSSQEREKELDLIAKNVLREEKTKDTKMKNESKNNPNQKYLTIRQKELENIKELVIKTNKIGIHHKVR